MSAPRNILWICTDQQPFANRPAVARNLPLQARMAEQGVRFENAYTVLPICSPARASMLTGTYPHMHGLTENDGRFGGRAELDDSDWMVHQPMIQAGYRAAWFGKWHLSQTETAQDFGFEGFSLPDYGYPYKTDAYRDYLSRFDLPAPRLMVELPGENGTKRGDKIALMECSDWPEFESGCGVLEGSAETHEAFFVSRLAQDWLRQAGDDPFFLRVDTWGPHPPYFVGGAFRDMFRDEGDLRPANFQSDLAGRPDHHRDYRDRWAELSYDDADWRLLAQRSLEQAALVETALLELLETLDTLGLRDNTLVIVTADHGDAVASNGAVANKGGLMVEETLSVPLYLRGPGVKAGTVRQELVSNLDIAPTVLRAAGVPVPDILQGSDLGPLCTNDASPGWRDGLMLQHNGLHQQLLQRAWRQGDWKLVLQEDGFTELYDLRRDPIELHNLAGDADCQFRLAEMKTALLAEMARLGDCGERQDRLAGMA